MIAGLMSDLMIKCCSQLLLDLVWLVVLFSFLCLSVLVSKSRSPPFAYPACSHLNLGSWNEGSECCHVLFV